MSDIQGQEDKAPEGVKEPLWEAGQRARAESKKKREAKGLGWAATAVEQEQRVQFVHLLLRKGYTPGQIHAELEEKYCIGKDTRTKLLKAARERLVAMWDAVAREELAATLMDRYDYAYQVGMENKQVGAAIGAIQAQARMVGIDQPGGSYSKKKNKRST